jgi:hypothetical protein
MDTYAGQQTTRFDSYPWEPRPRSFISKLKLDTSQSSFPEKILMDFRGTTHICKKHRGKKKKFKRRDYGKSHQLDNALRCHNNPGGSLLAAGVPE